MRFLHRVKEFFQRYFFYDKWTCNVCRKEIFSDQYFCSDCEKLLPKNNDKYCLHCGRKTIQEEKYCLSCKQRMLSIDTARSCFLYEYPISALIKKYKYGGKKYLANVFTKYLFETAKENGFNVDYIVYVPMTEKALKKRGFNHGELLARNLSKLLNVEVSHCIQKVKDTKRQAKSSAKERLENLKGCFRLKERRHLKGKSVLLVDDVLTTGATSETIARLIKGAGASKVILLTIASVPFDK